MTAQQQITPTPVETEVFKEAITAVDRLQELYERNTAFLRKHFEHFLAGEIPSGRIRAYYPRVRIITHTHVHQFDSRSSFGFVAGPGEYATSITRPALFRDYLIEQLQLLITHHGEPIMVEESDEPIPIHFAYFNDNNLAADLRDDLPDYPIRDIFDTPDLADMDNVIIDAKESLPDNEPSPLALFRAARVDYSLHRLRHYTGTDPQYFQNFIVFTNYPFYTDAFARVARETLAQAKSDYFALVEPGNRITRLGSEEPEGEIPTRTPQMPAYHLLGPQGNGVTMINIGAGPSNARNATDHVAVLRPYAWLMLGHCAGLRNTQRLGDYVLAHGYLREDHVLDEELPPWVPVPPLAEVQVALEEAGRAITGLESYELKRVMRTGTVASVDNRNWELSTYDGFMHRLSKSRAVALDMESAVIAANGFRYRVPYGTLLCVSDKPMHGEIKMAGMASSFYNQRVQQHLDIGLAAVEKLKTYDRNRLHSRKLRDLTEVAFR